MTVRGSSVRGVAAAHLDDRVHDRDAGRLDRLQSDDTGANVNIADGREFTPGGLAIGQSDGPEICGISGAAITGDADEPQDEAGSRANTSQMTRAGAPSIVCRHRRRCLEPRESAPIPEGQTT
jgi:hypothetical protein